MKPRGRIIFCVALVLIAAILSWLWCFSEPRYQGMPASDYVFGVINTNRFSINVANAKLKPMGSALAVPALTKIAGHDDIWWRRLYLQIYPRLPLWLQKSLGPAKSNRQIVMNAVIALGEFGREARSASSVLLRYCDRSNADLGFNALQALKRMGPPPAEAVPVLTRVAISTNHSHACELAIDLLKSLDPAGEHSAQALHNVAFGSRTELRAPALNALGNMARRSRSLLTNHCAALRDPSSLVRTVAVRTLNDCNALTWDALAPIIADLTSANRYARFRAAEVLGVATRFGDQITPLLCQAMHDADGGVRNAALLSLYSLANASMAKARWRFDAAAEVLRNGSFGMRWDVIGTLGALAPDYAEEMVPLLESVLGCGDNRVRARAAEQLGRLGLAARPALPELKKLLADDWSNVRDAAVTAINAIGETSP